MARVSVSRLTVISLIFYFISLLTPGFSYHTLGKPDTLYYPGFAVLINGFIGFLMLIISGDIRAIGLLAWLANPLILIAWIGISSKKKSMSIKFSVAALILSFFFFFIDELSTGDGSPLTNITASVGYVLWVLSMFFAVLASRRLEISNFLMEQHRENKK